MRWPLTIASIVIAAACTPRIEVAAPTEPITINMNVKIEHEIRVRVERDLDALFEEQPGIFGGTKR